MSSQETQNNNYLWQVLNPEAEYETVGQTIAPRLHELDRKKIGLFWNGKPSGDVLLESIGKLLTQRFAGLELIRFNLGINAGTENIQKMAAACDGVIAATGD
jgi:hypothetical protein